MVRNQADQVPGPYQPLTLDKPMMSGGWPDTSRYIGVEDASVEARDTVEVEDCQTVAEVGGRSSNVGDERTSMGRTARQYRYTT